MSEPKELLMPPDELVQLWEEACNALTPSAFLWRQAMYLYCARWGADQELEACCKWLIAAGVPRLSEEMYAALNRKAPSLKEQALEALKTADIGYSLTLTPAEVSIVRRALEALPDE